MTDVYDQLLDTQQPTDPVAPVAPTQSKDAYDTILDEFQTQQNTAMQQSLTQALKVAPQQAATTQQLAKASGLPEDVVERNQDVVQKQVKLQQLQSLLASSPILARQMQDPNFAKLAQDDANNLSLIERLWRQPSGGAVEGLGMGTAGIGDTLSIVQRNLMEGFSRTFLPEPIGGWDKVDKGSIAGPLLGADWQTVGNYLKAQGRDIQIPQLQQEFLDKVLAGIGQVGTQIGVGALTGGVGSGAFLYGQGVNAMTEKTQGDPSSQGAKDLAALLGGGVTAITEKWALDKLLGPMTVPIQNQLGAALARIGIAGASEGAQETIESIAQDSLRKFLTNPEAEIQVGQAFEEGGVGATVGAVVRTVVEAAAGVRSRGARTEQQAVNAERNAAFVEQLNQLAVTSELLKTSPESFEQFIEQAAQDGDVQDVYIDAKFLMQSGMADQLAQVSPSIAKQLPTALATGGTVQIPVGEYAAKVAPTEFAQGLLDHIKTDPQGFSRAEAQEYFQTQQQQLEQEIAQQLEAKTGDQEFMDSKQRVKDTVLTELNTLGRFTPQKNELDATLIAARTAVRAAQLGVTPEQFFEAQRLRFAAERIDGDTFSQDGQLQTDTPAFANWFGDSKVVDAQGKPLTVYHGTGVKFDTFDKGTLGSFTGADSAKGGFFFTSSNALAKQFQSEAQRKQAPYENIKAAINNLSDEQFKRLAKDAGDAYYDDLPYGDIAANQDEFTEARAEVTNRLLERLEQDNNTSYVDDRSGIDRVVKNYVGSELFQTGDTMQVYLSLNNPLVVELEQGSEFQEDLITNAIEQAKAEGNDGVIIKGMYDSAAASDNGSNQIASDVYIAFEPTQIKSAVGNAGTFDPNNPNILMQFAGVKARTAPIEKLAIAQQMESKGVSTGTIQRETGWFKGVDDMWRFEISDDQAKFTAENFQIDYPYTLDEVLDHPELYAAYPNLGNINVAFTKDDGDEASGAYYESRNRILVNWTGNRDETLSVLLHEVQHAIQSRENFARGGSMESEFTESVKRAVQDLQEYSTNQAEGWKRYNWRKVDNAEEASELARNALVYQSAQRLIDYSKRDKPSGVFRLIRNEMQWIYGERFYGNRAANDIQRMFYDIPKRGDKRNSFLRNMAWEGGQFLLDSIPAEQRQSFKDDPRMVQSMVKALERQASKARAELKPLNELEKKSRTAKALQEKTKHKRPYEIYRALAGEIEARTTQARQNLTAEERRNRPVRRDMDVDPSEAIVVIGGRELRVPTVMQSAGAQAPRGAFNPENNTIALLKNADLSTFLHEAGHFFFESDIRLAKEIAQANAALGPETMTQGESEILADVGQLFTWLGIEGNIDAQLATWNGLSFEQKRAYHEKTAESFERYLFEGKAPSIELQSYFQQFRAWLVNVYRSIKDFVAKNPDAGELSDEVRAVFDRMLATTEEIQLAEQARSMMPLFRTKADADNIGMTEEEFKAYQKQETQATLDAIQDLQARGLRDLQWTRNARNREVKRLQRQAGEVRKEIRDEATAEVVAEPVYKAWQFLTRKLQDGDKVVPVQRPKTDPNVVEPMVDSMFTAIAKLGGLNKQEAIDTWGVEEAERPNSGVFGKPVLRVTGGKSIDGMVEALAQYGYLPLDENGKADIADLESKFDDELRGDPQYSVAYDYSIDDALMLRPGEQMDVTALTAGRFDMGALMEMNLTSAEIELLKARRMVAKDGLHPDLVAELPGIEMSSGDELVRKLLAANPLKDEIEARAEAMMMERYGELATPEAIEREADKSIHNEARAKMVATEANALARATGERKILAKAAKSLAETMVARIRIRGIKPTQYASAEARAAKAAAKAMKDGNLQVAGAEKRSQLVNTYATKAAYDAQDEINSALRYLKKFEKEGSRKGLDNDYLEQIDTLLERFDLRKGQSLKTIDKRTSLAQWIAAQEQAGIEPSLPDHILAEANRTHFKNLTVEEFRGLVDSIRQIEHLGRLKKKLLTAKDQRELDAIVDEIRQRIEQSSGGRIVDNEKRNTVQSQLSHFGRWVSSAHRKAASVTRELDGLTDGGPMWEYFTRSMNEAGDKEATMRAEAATRLHELAKSVLTGEKMGGKGRFFPSLNRSLNRGERIAMALNWGNESNRQRLLGGKGWTVGQVQPVLDSLTSEEWTFVQGVWDFFESYRPDIAAKERRVYGKEPDWIEPSAFEITTADGKQLQIRGGYYPVKYDPNQSGKAGEFAEAEEAKAMMRAAYTAATTRRSFTKSRAEEVQGRPLLLTFDGIWQGANEVIHDLSWHEWLIDANRLLKRLDSSIRNGFGAEYVDTLRKTVKDVARGDTPASNMVEKSLTHIRNGSSIVGMGWNITTALMQPLGLSNTAVRIGGKWLARGLSEFYGSPAKMVAVAEEVQSKSKFMANRALTLNREIADVRNKLESDKSEIRQRIEGSFFIMIQKMQAGVDYPTWLGAYAKAISDPANINQDGTINEERAVSLADQAVIDAQGSGQMKDLAEVQRGHPLMKLFTNFYSYFNVLMNLTTEQTKKRVRDKEYLGLVGDYTLLMILPAVMSAVIRNAVKGEDDEDEYAKAIASELVGYPFGMFVGLRELAGFAQLAAGVGNPGLGYSGPAGLRFFSEMNKLGQQVGQGELDWALFKAANNVGGLLFHYPAGQVNRAVEGAAALIEGKTDNPLAPLVGVQK